MVRIRPGEPFPHTMRQVTVKAVFLILLLAAGACRGPSPPAREEGTSASPPGFALVVARAVSQSDPRPAPCGPDGSCGDSMYLGAFDQGRTVAGVAVPRRFEARIRFHTPLISPTDLAMIVERAGDGSLTVLRRAGFNDRTNTACFVEPDEQPVDWQPAAQGISTRNNRLCYTDWTRRSAAAR